MIWNLTNTISDSNKRTPKPKWPPISSFRTLMPNRQQEACSVVFLYNVQSRSSLKINSIVCNFQKILLGLYCIRVFLRRMDSFCLHVFISVKETKKWPTKRNVRDPQPHTV